MKIFLLGYMGSGKSFIGKQLSEKMNIDFVDMDHQIEENEGKTISEIFQSRGEVYFRKLERRTLENLIQREEAAVISLGGGTPCYGDNMDLIRNASDITSFYLKLNIENLTERLFSEKDSRPMISHLEDKEKLEEFIRKHLFERGFYYNQSDHVINCDDRSAEEIIEQIYEKLG
ncbi:shikimate kinase [Gramella sp. MT6]|uniref:shikimate kinase n=1 Tax=Gramella sp. MT6 TaxID=2705471 RepID=UPI001C5FF1BE|nr:shikimate kinase [Gramella sp. MT6]QYA25678.1 shikimate kinase [Gramella sp. MT6]